MAVVSFRSSLLLICALSTVFRTASATGRKLHQSNGPAKTYGDAASASSADLIDDPAGRAHLLVSFAGSVSRNRDRLQRFRFRPVNTQH